MSDLQAAGPARRMGPVGSDNWHAMLDGAEDILREEGHAALTSRRIAERIGVKQRLVYYYFHTMDDLIVATFHRLSERELDRLRQAAESALPVREIWEVCIHTSDARLVTEFMALASRIEGLRQEVIFFIEESRAIQVRTLVRALEAHGGGTSASNLAILATSVALALGREEQLGVTSGHAEMKALIGQMLAQLEPGN